MKKLTLALFLAGALLASGFNISEHGTRATAMGSAFTARAADPSAIFYNPAGIAFLGKTWIYLGGTLIAPSGYFEGEAPFPGQGVREDLEAQYFPVPNFYLVKPLSEKLTFGLGLYSPFGLGTKWKDPENFTGRYISTDSATKMLTLNPVLAYRLSQKFALAAGAQISFSKVHVEQYIPLYDPFTFRVEDVGTVSLDSNWKTTLGFNLGLIFRPSSKLSVGMTYRHKQQADYTGKAIFSQLSTGNMVFDALVRSYLPFDQDVSVNASLTYPSSAVLGIAVYPTERLSLEVDLEYTFWSQYKSMPISFPDHEELNPSEETTKEYFHDNITVRFGLEYLLKEGFYLRAGYVYDQEASDPQSVTPLLPDTSRHLISAGIGKALNENMYLDLSAIYLIGLPRSTEGKCKYGYEGTYHINALLLGVNLGYKF